MKTIFSSFIFSVVLSFFSIKASAQFTVSVSILTAPPELPVYVQPACPVEGFLWIPGYWAYDDMDGYYWVPGVWIVPPVSGYLWTPGYWGYGGGIYGWYPGYWGMHVGYYGGVHYGYGYNGIGFTGGEWRQGAFRYNTAVMNVNRTVVHNTYINRTVINNTVINNRSSFNGPGGANARPTPQEEQAMHENHIRPTTMQVTHNQVAAHDRNQFATVNAGRPAAVAMNTVGGRRFSARGTQAPKPVERPAAGMGVSRLGASSPNSHPVNSNANHPPGTGHPAATNNNRAVNNNIHPSQPPQNRATPNRNPQQQRIQPTQQQPRQQQRPQQVRPQQHVQQPRPQQQRVQQQRPQQPRPQPHGPEPQLH